MTVDGHQHFWRYTPAEYGWLGDSMRALRRDFLPEHLGIELEAGGVGGSIAVQAIQTLGETRFLLRQAHGSPFVLGVVGWVPLVDRRIREVLEELAPDPLLKGCRHVLQDEPDDGYMLQAAFHRGMRAVTHAGLVYEILVYERQLPRVLELVDRHPRQVFVLDHLGKPQVRGGSLDRWRRLIRDLARRPRVFCKLSGLATEADWKRWTRADLLPYIEVAVEAFGPRRILFGSDWPMCLLATTYARWLRLVRDYADTLATGERERVLGGTAVEVYGLECGP